MHVTDGFGRERNPEVALAVELVVPLVLYCVLQDEIQVLIFLPILQLDENLLLDVVVPNGFRERTLQGPLLVISRASWQDALRSLRWQIPALALALALDDTPMEDEMAWMVTADSNCPSRRVATSSGFREHAYSDEVPLVVQHVLRHMQEAFSCAQRDLYRSGAASSFPLVLSPSLQRSFCLREARI